MTEELMKAYDEGRVILLPVPIGAKVYVPYRITEPAGDDNYETLEQGIEEAKLTGYIKEDDREFYTVIFQGGDTDDIPKEELCTTFGQALVALARME